ncbi:MAG TPA: serine hydrolase [Coleofasciculaceae cyanobacterium]
MKFRWFLLSCVSVFLLAPSAQATRLESWHFDPVQNQLDLTVDSQVQPKVALIQNPTRLLVDLPNTQSGQRTIHQPFGGAIAEVRVAQTTAQTTRLVVELSEGYSLQPDAVQVTGDSASHWRIKLTSIQPSSTQPSSTAALKTNALLEEDIPINPGAASLFAGIIHLGEDMTPLRSQVQDLIDRYSFLHTGMFFIDLQTGNYLDLNGEETFSAASTIKLPILIAFFQDLDAGKISLNETLVMRDDLIASGSGTMQDEPVGTPFSVQETVDKMITISDNTATNMIIDRLGGIDRLNQRFQSWGLQNTVIRNWLGDFSGTNTTSAKDLVRLLALVNQNQLISASSRSQALDLLHRTTTRTLLPAGLGAGATIADKTGDIGFLIGDAGIIEMPSGRQYLAGIFVKRPYDDVRGRDFIRQVSQQVYQYLDR